MRFSPVTMIVALVIGLGAGGGVAAAVSGGDNSSKSSGSFVDAQIEFFTKLANDQMQILLQNDGKGGLKAQMGGDERLAKDDQNLLYSQQGGYAAPDLPDPSKILSDAAAEVIAVGSGNVVSVGSGNVISVGSGNILSNGSSGFKWPPGAVISTNDGAVIAVGSGNFGGGPYHTLDVDTLPITQQGCSDPWLNKAIDERTHTGTVPDGGYDGICNVGIYGLAQGQYFLSKDQYTKAVNDYFDSKCPDIWVTRAITEVTNRQPNGPECEVWRYNGGQWGSYQELKSAVEKAGLYTRPRSNG
ncbi:MAG: hypothetical protein QOD53_2256 [Thermoleophilaceae bacterium]|nr:hypothetical protein [Thermoleophilaceae bacterium]